MSDSSTDQLTFNAPATTVTDSLPIAISSAQPVGGQGNHLLIALWVPLYILPPALQAASTAGTSLADVGVMLSGGGGTWQAAAVAGSGEQSLHIALRNDTAEPWGSIDAGAPLTLTLPVAAKSVTNTEIQHQFGASFFRGHTRLTSPSKTTTVTVAPAAAAPVGRPAPQPQASLTADHDNPTAVPPGSKVIIRWQVENGITGSLVGPFPGRKALALGGGAHDAFQIAEGHITVHVTGPQVYVLRATVDMGDAGEIEVIRTLVLNAWSDDQFGFLTVTPSETLPYGQAIAHWAAWGVSDARIKIGDTGGIRHLLSDGATDGHGPVDLHLGRSAEVHLILETAQGEVAELDDLVTVNRWVTALTALPSRQQALALAYACSETQGALAFCATDGLWVADVGVEDPLVDKLPEPQFAPVTAPADVRRWDDVTAHGEGLAALRRVASGALELARFDLNGAPLGTPVTVPLPVPHYAISAHGDGRLTVWNLDSGAAGKDLRLSSRARIDTVAVTADGYRAISGDERGVLTLWNLVSGRQERWIAPGTSGVKAVAASSDGRFAVAGFDDGQLVIWDLDSDAHTSLIPPDTSSGAYTARFPITAVAVTPDSQRVITGSHDGKLFIWDVNGRTQTALGSNSHAMKVNAIAPTPDGRCVITAYDDRRTNQTYFSDFASRKTGDIVVWDLEKGQVACTLGNATQISAVSVTPDGRRLIAGADDGSVTVWNLESGAIEKVFNADAGMVQCVSVTPDGRRAVSGHNRMKIMTWDLDSLHDKPLRDEPVHTMVTTPACGLAANAVVAARAQILSINGRLLIAAPHETALWFDPHNDRFSAELAVRVTDGVRLVAAGETVIALDPEQGEMKAIPLTPSGASPRVIAGYKDDIVRVWNLQTGEIEHTLSVPNVMGVAITADDRYALTYGWQSAAIWWDLATGQPLYTVTGQRSLDMAVDVRRAVFVGLDNRLNLWNLATGEVTSLSGDDTAFELCRIAPDGRRAASLAGDGTLTLWKLETGQAYRTVQLKDPQQDDPFNIFMTRDMLITPDGSRVIVTLERPASRKDQKVHSVAVCALQDGHLEFVDTTIHWQDAMMSSAVSPDGRRAIVGTYEGAVHVLNLDERAVEYSFPKYMSWIEEEQIAHRMRINQIAVTPDGRRMLTASDDNTVIVWNLEIGQGERILQGHNEVVKAVAVTPDGRRVVTGAEDNNIIIWNLETGEAEQALRGPLPGGKNVRLPFRNLGNKYQVRCVALSSAKVARPIAPSTDAPDRAVIAKSVPLVVDGLLVQFNDGGYKVPTPNAGEVPQDWVYNSRLDSWVRCGHGLDIDPDGLIAFRSGSPRLWAIGGRPVGEGEDGAAGHTLGLPGLHVFDPMLYG